MRKTQSSNEDMEMNRKRFVGVVRRYVMRLCGGKLKAMFQ